MKEQKHIDYAITIVFGDRPKTLKEYVYFSLSDIQNEGYLNGLEDLGLCRTVEDFWQIYLSLPLIGSDNASHYYLFKVCLCICDSSTE